MNFIKELVNNFGIWLTLITSVMAIFTYFKNKKVAAIVLTLIAALSLISTVSMDGNKSSANAPISLVTQNESILTSQEDLKDQKITNNSISISDSNELQQSIMLSEIKSYQNNGDGTVSLKFVQSIKDNFGALHNNALVYNDIVGGDNRQAMSSFMIEGNYNRTKGSLIILENAMDTKGSAILNIWGDGKIIYTTPEIKAGLKPIEFNADISGVSSVSYQISVIKSGGYVNTFGIADTMLYQDKTNTSKDDSINATMLYQLKPYKKDGDGTCLLKDFQVYKDNFGNVHTNGISFNDIVGGNNRQASRYYIIDDKYKRTKGKFFILEGASDTKGAAVLNIWGDDKIISSTEEIKAGMKPIEFDVDISGISNIGYQISVVKSGGHVNTFAISDVGLYP